MDSTANENAFDEHDDIALLNGLRGAMVPELKERFSEFVTYARPVLEGAGVATYNDDGSVWVGIRGLQMLTIDALRQLNDKLETRVRQLEDKVKLLTDMV